jgi:hypothetical protein
MTAPTISTSTSWRSIMTDSVPEKATVRLSGVLKDELGNLIAAAGLTSLKLSLYLSSTKGIINSRNDQSILNTNGGSLDGSGNFSLTLRALDNAMISSAPFEWHVAEISWVYNTGTDTGRGEIWYKVENFAKVT